MEESKIHIGKIVANAFEQSGKTKTEFAEAIGIYVQNLNREFKNKDWQVIKLISAGKFLKHDFGYLFSIDDEEKHPPKVVLQIEISRDKVSDVLEAINDKSLYEILTDKK